MVDVIGRAKVIVTSEVDSTSVTGAGSKMGNLLGGALKKTAIGAAAGVGALLGTAIAKGFSRLSAIEEAEAKLRGLGHSAQTITQVMEDALASVKGTAFGLGDAAGIAASAIASGVQPGKDLERTLKLVADAATIGGTSLSEMGAIFNKVSATGKAQGEVLNQLGERGIPILQLLSKSLGVSVEAVLDLSEQGKISFADFQTAIEEGMGGAALKSGETFRGALANAGAALGRFGAALLGESFKDGPALFGAITEKLDELTPAAERVGKKIAAFNDEVVKLQKSKDWKQLKSDIKSFAGDVGTLAGALGKTVGWLNKMAKATTGSGLLPWLRNLAEQVAPISKIAEAIELIASAIRKVNAALNADTGNSDLLNKNYSGGGGLSDLLTRASGGPASGWTVVGERGAELVNLPNGSYVHNANDTQDMLAATGGDTYNTFYNITGPTSLAELRQQDAWFRQFGTRFASAASAVGP